VPVIHHDVIHTDIFTQYSWEAVRSSLEYGLLRVA